VTSHDVESLATCVLVEDHEDIVAALKPLLGMVGVNVVAATATGAEGLELIRERKPTIAIVDFNLSDMSALDLLGQTSEQDRATTAFILFTAEGAGIAERAVGAGFRAAVGKGVTPRALLDAVQAVLAGNVFVDAASPLTRPD
jgi:DNA-binding NarL/FixJ family response regulator